MTTVEELRFDGLVAVVTGAGQGLGRSYAHLLAARGARVVVNDLNGGAADQVVEEIVELGGQATADSHSVCDHGGAIVKAATNKWGRVDIVVNNAGVIGGPPFERMTETDHRRIIDTHIHGSIQVAQAAWPHFKDQQAGAIVNIASSAALGSGNTIYGTAKAGCWGLARNLALAGAEHGIRANAVMPQAWTPMSVTSPDAWMKKTMSENFAPELVAPFVAWLAHPDCPLSGECFSVGGGRVARVLMAVTPGVIHHPPTPESYGQCLDELMTIENLFLVRDGVEELHHAVRLLGIEK
jgi:NAD(P)-dependent dehydrogenase (short-subunit alcohol dehydrogenase family)